MTLAFASGNQHKLNEIRKKLPANLELVSMRELGYEGEIDETGTTLEQNADIKATFIAEHFEIDCFADDTGLEIEALNGQPGVYSARFAGEDCTFDENMDKTLKLLQGNDHRDACFRTVICLIKNGKKTFFEGRINGTITLKKQGADGFGYDPIFKPEGYNKTFAELSIEEKNKISHRALAVDKLVTHLSRT